MTIKCFLDTTYLMPLFGLKPDVENLYEQFPKIAELNRYIFLYSPVSIIEIKWQIIKLGRKECDIENLEKEFSEALTMLKIDDCYLCIDFLNADINDLSFELRKLGHADYFDTVIASSAMWEAEIFITEDEPLKKVMQTYYKRNMDADFNRITIYNWKAFHAQSS